MKTRLIFACFVLIAVAVVIPVLSLHTLPFTDLPNHLAEAVIIRDATNPQFLLSQFFLASRLTWFQPAIGHAVFCSWFPSVEIANRVLYVLYCLAIPFSMLCITRTCAGNWAVAFLSLLMVWNYSAVWGFAGFTLGIPLVLMSVSQQVRCFSNKAWAHVFALGVLFVLIYWMHALLFLFALLTFIMIGLSTFLADKSTTSRHMLGRSLLAPLPAMGLFAIWVCNGQEFSSGNTTAFLWKYYLSKYIPSMWGRLAGFITNDWKAIAYGDIGKEIALCFALVVLVPSVVCLFRLPYHKVPMTTARMATIAFLGSALVCFVLLPNGLPGQAHLYERFSVFCYLALISVLSWTLPVYWPKILSKTLILLVVAGYVALWGHYFWRFRTVDRDFVTFHRTMPDTRQGFIGYLICDPQIQGRAALRHYNDYEIIWHRRPTLTRVGSYRFGIITQRLSLPRYHELLSRKQLTNIISVIDQYNECNYFVVQGKDVREMIKQRADLSPVHEHGAWSLFKKHETANQVPEDTARTLADPQH